MQPCQVDNTSSVDERTKRRTGNLRTSATETIRQHNAEFKGTFC